MSISIYDISEEEVLIRSYTPEYSELMDIISLIFGGTGGTESEDAYHPLMAVISFKLEDEEVSTTVYFGDSEYITTIENGVKINWENDELRNFLNQLADE